MQTNGHVPWSQWVRWARSFHRELGGSSLGASACGVHGYWVKCMWLEFIYARDDQNFQSSYFGVVKNVGMICAGYHDIELVSGG